MTDRWTPRTHHCVRSFAERELQVIQTTTQTVERYSNAFDTGREVDAAQRAGQSRRRRRQGTSYTDKEIYPCIHTHGRSFARRKPVTADLSSQQGIEISSSASNICVATEPKITRERKNPWQDSSRVKPSTSRFACACMNEFALRGQIAVPPTTRAVLKHRRRRQEVVA